MCQKWSLLGVSSEAYYRVLTYWFCKFSVSLHLHRVLSALLLDLRCFLVKLWLLRWIERLNGSFLYVNLNRLIKRHRFSSRRIRFPSAISTTWYLKWWILAFLFRRFLSLPKHTVRRGLTPYSLLNRSIHGPTSLATARGVKGFHLRSLLTNLKQLRIW